MSSKLVCSPPRLRTTGRKLRPLFAITVSSLLLFAVGTASTQPTTSSVKYEFGRPVRADEHTYDWYRRTHADAAAARYGVSASEVGDGMDTWHWWVGVDNPGFWREMAKVTSKSPGNLVGAKADFLRLLHTVPRNKRFELMGLINDPDTVAAEKPDQYGLMLDRMKEGTLTWDPDVFGYSSGVIGLQLFVNKQFDPQKWSLAKYLAGSGQRRTALQRRHVLRVLSRQLQADSPARSMSTSRSGRTSARTSATSSSEKECCSAVICRVTRLSTNTFRRRSQGRAKRRGSRTTSSTGRS